MSWFEHIAGRPTVSGVQRCERCGRVLQDSSDSQTPIGRGEPIGVWWAIEGTVYDNGQVMKAVLGYGETAQPCDGEGGQR